MSIDEKNEEVNRVFNNRIEQLNAAFEAAEKELRAMRIVIDADYLYSSWDDYDQPQCKCYAHIGVVKLQGEWRLCHGYSDDCHPDDICWKPIRDASVHERIRAAHHIDKLREAIVRQKEKTIPQVESALAALAKELERFPK